MTANGADDPHGGEAFSGHDAVVGGSDACSDRGWGGTCGGLEALRLAMEGGSLILVVGKRWEIVVVGVMMPVLEVMVVAAVLLLLVLTLVRVVVRLVVGGALALPSPRDPFADNAWGVWRAGGSQKPLRGCLSCVSGGWG